MHRLQHNLPEGVVTVGVKETLYYHEFLSAAETKNELLGLKCNSCRSYTCPPKMVCLECASDDCEVVALSKEGTIRTFTVIRVLPEGFDGDNIVVGMVELVEGPWLMVNIKTNLQATMEIIGKKGIIGFDALPGDKYSGGKRVVLSFKLDDER